jgi:excisionase family DNA binding protein
MQPLLTVPEVAGILKVSKDYVYDLARRGELRPLRLGRSAGAPLRFRQSAIEAWLEAHEGPEFVRRGTVPQKRQRGSRARVVPLSDAGQAG